MPMVDTSALIEGFFDGSSLPINPAARQAEDETIDWLWKIGFLSTAAQEEHLRSFKFGLYHGVATPTVDLPHLLIGMKWFCWGSLADDQYDNYDGGERERRLADVTKEFRAIVSGDKAGGIARNPVVTGFADYWPQLTASASPRARQRLADHFLDYMQAVEFQNRYHIRGHIPDAATFLMLRRNTIAMIFQADVLEVVSELDIPDVLRDSLHFRELVWCFADITAWHNDVYGLEKDIADGQTCNAVRVTALSENCTLQQAVDRVLNRARQRQQLFLELQERLPGLADRLGLPQRAAAQAALLARDLRAYIHANLIWVQQTHRYNLDRPRIKGTFDDVITSLCVADGTMTRTYSGAASCSPAGRNSRWPSPRRPRTCGRYPWRHVRSRLSGTLARCGAVHSPSCSRCDRRGRWSALTSAGSRCSSSPRHSSCTRCW